MGGLNTYLYSAANSIIAIDPYGLDFWVYHYRQTAEGFGHSGLILPNADGSYTQYSQGAADPDAPLRELMTWQQDAVVHVTESPTFPQPKAELVKVPTQYNDVILEAIDEYIKEDAPYHVTANNCVDFITDTANEAEDVKIKSDSIPNDFFDMLIEQHGAADQPE